MSFENRSIQHNDLEDHSVAQLVDLLGKATKDLLGLMSKKRADGALINYKRKEVQLIQEAIYKRKSLGKK